MLMKPLIIAGMTAFGALSLTACDTNEGPAEEIGEDIDDAADDIEDEVEEGTD